MNEDEAAPFREALTGPARPWWGWLTNPFERLPEGAALALAAFVAAGLTLLTRFGVRFDGFLDTHFVARVPRLATSLLEEALAWPVAALVVWAVARASGSRGRVLDHVIFIGLARAAQVAIAAPLVALAGGDARALTAPRPLMMAAIAVSALTGLAWYVTMLFTGYGLASGLRGARRVISFVIAVVAAEVVSKVGLYVAS